jgi:quinol-cytochrome oxidoreductase complex cytochrome b subunit
MVVQIVRGFIVRMFFSAGDAFYSVFYFTRETLTGESFRFLHANGVSGIFLAMYLHVFRGVRFSRFFLLPVWFSGLILFLLLIIISFLGYSLPWAQMSFWAATVITNLVTSIPEVGGKIVLALWGDFSVRFLTLNRFYRLHFLLPFVVLALMVVHILLLHLIHTKGPIQVKGDSTVFFPGFWVKDIWLFLVMIFLVFFLRIYSPIWLMERDIFLESNPIRAPEHIVPEWYFLPFYAVLRGVPSKLGGVVAILGVFVCLFLISFSRVKRNPLTKSILATIFFFWILLFWVGGLPVVFPFDVLGKVTVLLFFICFIPALLY